MSELCFLDTNVLVYANDGGSPVKQDRARLLCADLRRRGRAVVSLQVLQEFYFTATRKLGIKAEEAQRQVEFWTRGHVVSFHESDVVRAIELHRLAQISFWDALIVHAARLAECAVLFTEDMQHGSAVGGVKIVNPFLTP